MIRDESGEPTGVESRDDLARLIYMSTKTRFAYGILLCTSNSLTHPLEITIMTWPSLSCKTDSICIDSYHSIHAAEKVKWSLTSGGMCPVRSIASWEQICHLIRGKMYSDMITLEKIDSNNGMGLLP